MNKVLRLLDTRTISKKFPELAPELGRLEIFVNDQNVWAIQ